MTEDKYTDSDKYQQEIAEQYEKRVSKFSVEEVRGAMKTLGIDIDPNTIKEAEVGNVNATYLTSTLVIKINNDRETQDYLPNKIVSDRLGGTQPVVRVLSYDFFEKTGYEILVMERAPGMLLLDDMPDLTEAEQADLFKQTLGVVKSLFDISFDSFGSINNEKESFPTYSEQLKTEFMGYVKAIREQKLADEEDIAKIEKYFLANVHIFDNEKSVFVHTDLHMGNILHDGNKLTAVIDFDSALRAPPVRALVPLLGLIGQPSQFVEGTKDFPKYKGKTFYHLLPVLRESLPEVFADSLLVKKLNLIGICLGLMWVADNWSADWNKEMIRNIVNNELADTEADLQNSYHGKILAH